MSIIFSFFCIFGRREVAAKSLDLINLFVLGILRCTLFFMYFYECRQIPFEMEKLLPDTARYLWFIARRVHLSQGEHVSDEPEYHRQACDCRRTDQGTR